MQISQSSHLTVHAIKNYCLRIFVYQYVRWNENTTNLIDEIFYTLAIQRSKQANPASIQSQLLPVCNRIQSTSVISGIRRYPKCDIPTGLFPTKNPNWPFPNLGQISTGHFPTKLFDIFNPYNCTKIRNERWNVKFYKFLEENLWQCRRFTTSKTVPPPSAKSF